jgi:hypothetical protein
MWFLAPYSADHAGCLAVPGEEVKLVQQVVGLVEHRVTAAEHVLAGEVLDLVAKVLDLPDLGHGEQNGTRVILGGRRDTGPSVEIPD